MKQIHFPNNIHFNRKKGIIINMLRQSTISRNIFYKGITLKDYLRKSAALFIENDNDQTLLVDELNEPLVKDKNLNDQKQKRSKYTKLDTAQFSTKISTSKSIDQYQYFPELQFQKPQPILKKTNKYLPNCSDLHLKPNLKKNIQHLPLIDLSKSKNMKRLNPNQQQVIKKEVIHRQRCMASRQVSLDSQEQGQSFGVQQLRMMSNRQYIEQVKKEVQKRRYSNMKKSDKETRLRRRSYLQSRSFTHEK